MAYRWFVFLAAIVAACNSTEKRAAPPPAPRDAAVEVRPKVNLEVQRFEGPPVVLPLRKAFSLLDPGKAPKAPLRYLPTAGTATYATETRLRSRRLANGTWGEQQAISPTRTAFAITVAPDRPLVARALPGEIVGKVTPDATAYLASWKAIEGRELSIDLDPRGQLGAIKFADDPATQRSREATDELVQRFLAVTIPVPEEPVGLGAKWRVVTVLRQAPAIVKQTATYTLLARTAKGWKIGVEIARIGEAQTLREPTAHGEPMAELVALVRRFSGTLHVDPTMPLASGKLAVDSTIHVRVSQPKRKQLEEIVEDVGTVELSAKRSPR